MHIFLDANVLFSAAKSDSAARQLLSLLTANGHSLCADAYVIAEARRNLGVKAGADSTTALEAVLRSVQVSAVRMANSSPHSSWLPAKDRPVLDAAIAQKCEALVTGDRAHFGVGYGKSFGGVMLYSPGMLAETLL